MSRRLLNLPNVLTLARIGAIPLVVVCYNLPTAWGRPAAAALFLVSSLTDWLDGYLARKLNQTSAFGAFLDPVADKLMVAAALIVLVQLDRTHSVIALIIIGREIAISALREWMAKAGKPGSVAVSFIGKLKTAFQMISISLLLYWEPLAGIPIQLLGNLLINLAALLTLVSMFYYLRMAAKTLRE